LIDLAINPERQSARMSKITNDGLTRSGAGFFIAVAYGNNGRQRVNTDTCKGCDRTPLGARFLKLTNMFHIKFLSFP